MLGKHPNFTIGLEEELFLVDSISGELIKDWPTEFQAECVERYPNQIVQEFLTPQLELVTSPCETISEIEEQLVNLRQFCTSLGAPKGISLLASSTHPSAIWEEQSSSKEPRYQRLNGELGLPSNRMLVGGMHVHVGLVSMEARLTLLNEMSHYLPVVLALSASSPFWRGIDSGHCSYRASILQGLPRSGPSPLFSSVNEYKHYLSTLLQQGVVGSGREIWWDARVSSRYPTVEFRLADTCTNHRDAIAISALIQCLAKWIMSKDERLTKSALRMQKMIAPDNRWQAQRYGLEQGRFIGELNGHKQTIKDLLLQLLECLRPTAVSLGCEPEFSYCETIAQTGTSSDKQRQLFKQLNTGDRDAALKTVTQDLIKRTMVESAPRLNVKHGT